MHEQELKEYEKALEKAYKKALEEIWGDGVKTAEETMKLKELREKYQISAEEHLKLEEEIIEKLKGKKKSAKRYEEYEKRIDKLREFYSPYRDVSDLLETFDLK